jgi:hypothetical protein
LRKAIPLEGAITVTMADDITALRARLDQALTVRDQLIIKREERLSESQVRHAAHDALRAAVHRTYRESERLADGVRNEGLDNGASGSARGADTNGAGSARGADTNGARP